MSPQTVFLVLTTHCDKSAECEYCFYNVEPERKVRDRLELPVIESLMKKLGLLNVSNLYLTGGEPLLRNDLEQIISAAYKMEISTQLLSNGRSLTIERVASLEASGLGSFILSLSDISAADIRTIENVKKFKSVYVSIIFVITAANFKLVPEIMDLAFKMETGIFFQPAYIPASSPAYSSLSPSKIDPFDWSWLYSALLKWAAPSGNRNYLNLMHDFYNKHALRPQRCGMGKDAFVIDANGDVYPCFHRREIVCGNILRHETAEIFGRLALHASETSDAKCFGEHCISLHT